MTVKIKLALIVCFALLLTAVLLSGKANPDGVFLYGFKRLQEKSFLRLKQQVRERSDFYVFLLDNRLVELEHLVEKRKTGYILSASLRYSTTAGELTTLIKKGNLEDKLLLVIDRFRNHGLILEKLLRLCQKNDNSECKYIQDDINYLKIYSGELTSF